MGALPISRLHTKVPNSGAVLSPLMKIALLIRAEPDVTEGGVVGCNRQGAPVRSIQRRALKTSRGSGRGCGASGRISVR